MTVGRRRALDDGAAIPPGEEPPASALAQTGVAGQCWTHDHRRGVRRLTAASPECQLGEGHSQNKTMIRIIKSVITRFLRSFGYQLSHVVIVPRHEDIITGRVGKFDLLMNADHPIVGTIATYPSYSANLSRVVRYIQRKYPEMILIDVGANIGDGAALVRSETICPIVCIEGDPEYCALLKRNVERFSNVMVLNVFLGEKDGTVEAEIMKAEGTLRMQNALTTQTGTVANLVRTTTLDSVAQAHHAWFASAKVLKVDTDGYDLKIIRGAVEWIQANHPVLFFEYDRVYLDAVGEDGLSTLDSLARLNYDTIVFYDAFGRFVMASRLEYAEVIQQLDAYITERKGAFPYYDLCVFHRDDEDIARALIDAELSINKHGVERLEQLQPNSSGVRSASKLSGRTSL